MIKIAKYTVLFGILAMAGCVAEEPVPEAPVAVVPAGPPGYYAPVYPPYPYYRPYYGYGYWHEGGWEPGWRRY